MNAVCTAALAQADSCPEHARVTERDGRVEDTLAGADSQGEIFHVLVQSVQHLLQVGARIEAGLGPVQPFTEQHVCVWVLSTGWPCLKSPTCDKLPLAPLVYQNASRASCPRFPSRTVAEGCNWRICLPQPSQGMLPSMPYHPPREGCPWLPSSTTNQRRQAGLVSHHRLVTGCPWLTPSPTAELNCASINAHHRLVEGCFWLALSLTSQLNHASLNANHRLVEGCPWFPSCPTAQLSHAALNLTPYHPPVAGWPWLHAESR